MAGSKTMALRRQSRDGAKVIWLCLHTSEGGGTARDLRDADWWEGSSHAVSDLRELLTVKQGCVDPAFAAWTLRNGNNRSENIEQIGLAKWSREHWLTERMPQLRLTAQWLATRAKARGIPLTYVGVAGVRNRQPGVIQHNDYSKGTGDGDHWDCGPGYPIDVVITLARDIAAGMAPAAARTTPSTPVKPKQEDDMFNDDDRRLLREVKARLDDDGPIGKRTKDSRDRIFGMLQQRWYKVNASGRAVRCPASDPAAKPCAALDTLDGDVLVARIAGVTSDLTRVLAQSAPAAVTSPVVAAAPSPPVAPPSAGEIAASVPDSMLVEVIDVLLARRGAPVSA